MSIVPSVLSVAVILIVLLMATLFVIGMVEGWQAERRRQRVLADRVLAEARIQLRTAQATQQLLDVARDSMASTWPGTIRGEQVWEEDDHG